MIKPEEAKGIFGKWLTENILVLCASRLRSCWGLVLRGRVAVLSESGVEIRSEDGAAVVRLRFADVEGFEYREPKDAPEEIREAVPPEWKYAGTLLVRLPFRESLFFMEVPEAFDTSSPPR